MLYLVWNCHWWLASAFADWLRQNLIDQSWYRKTFNANWNRYLIKLMSKWKRQHLVNILLFCTPDVASCLFYNLTIEFTHGGLTQDFIRFSHSLHFFSPKSRVRPKHSTPQGILCNFESNQTNEIYAPLKSFNCITALAAFHLDSYFQNPGSLVVERNQSTCLGVPRPYQSKIRLQSRRRRRTFSETTICSTIGMP